HATSRQVAERRRVLGVPRCAHLLGHDPGEGARPDPQPDPRKHAQPTPAARHGACPRFDPWAAHAVSMVCTTSRQPNVKAGSVYGEGLSRIHGDSLSITLRGLVSWAGV